MNLRVGMRSIKAFKIDYMAPCRLKFHLKLNDSLAMEYDDEQNRRYQLSSTTKHVVAYYD